MHACMEIIKVESMGERWAKLLAWCNYNTCRFRYPSMPRHCPCCQAALQVPAVRTSRGRAGILTIIRGILAHPGYRYIGSSSIEYGGCAWSCMSHRDIFLYMDIRNLFVHNRLIMGPSSCIPLSGSKRSLHADGQKKTYMKTNGCEYMIVMNPT